MKLHQKISYNFKVIDINIKMILKYINLIITMNYWIFEFLWTLNYNNWISWNGTHKKMIYYSNCKSISKMIFNKFRARWIKYSFIIKWHPHCVNTDGNIT